jgi:hypothetical protein
VGDDGEEFMINETPVIERIKARFPEWIIAYDPSAGCFWLRHWRYPGVGWRRVGSLLRITAEIEMIERHFAPYLLPWEGRPAVSAGRNVLRRPPHGSARSG